MTEARARGWWPFIAVPCGILVGCLTGLYVIGFTGYGPTQTARWTEVFKSLLVVIQVGVIGGLVSLLLERFKSDQAQAAERIKRDQAQAANRAQQKASHAREVAERRTAMFHDTRKAYDAVKKARRVLKARKKEIRIPPSGPNPIDLAWVNAHRCLIARLGTQLIDAQLSLEFLQEQASHSSHLVPGTLSETFKGMEKELNATSKIMQQAALRDLTEGEIEHLDNFLEDGFESFATPYHSVIAELSQIVPYPQDAV